MKPASHKFAQTPLFLSLGRRLTAFIGIAIALGFVLIVWFYAFQHEKNLLRQNERTMHQVTESVVQGLETIMLTGHADVAQLYAGRLKAIGDVTDFRILRVSGLESFLDNETIYRVNEHRGDEDFLPRPTEKTVLVLAPDDPRMAEALASKRFVYFYDSLAGEPTLTMLWPILNGKDCTKCHGKTHEVRGLLKLTTSMAPVLTEVSRLRWQSAAVLSVAILVVIIVMSIVLRNAVVRPISELSSAMKRVSGGDLSQEVPVFGRDELAELATGFNSLLSELRSTYTGFQNEHDKLQTIIIGSRDGIVVTDGAGTIVLVNPSAEHLLRKSAQTLIDGGFESLIDNPQKIQRLLSQEDSHTDVTLYHERFLAISVAAIRTADGRLVGQGALIRDITEGKLLETTLRTMSNTDGLTGLANRRMLNESLDAEVVRAQQSGRNLSVMMLDVDHFKNFNDQYGHAQGDRVLQAVAEAARQSIRNIDLACRFGGEEFVVILTETPLDGAMVVAERLRELVETMRVDGLQVTISMGVAGWQETSASAAGTFLELADKALYVSKHSGRNRVSAAPLDPRKLES